MGKLLFSGSALLVAGAFLLVACCVFACAGGLVFGLAGSYADDAQEIKDLAEFSAGSVNDKVYATGTITDSDTISNDSTLGDITQYELVGYQVDRWDVTRGTSSGSGSSIRNTSYNGTWQDVSSAFNQFVLDNGELTVAPNDSISIDGDVHEYLLPGSGGNGYSDTYDGQSVKDGTLRLQGFKNGDLITVMGIRRDGQVLNAEKLYGGNRDEWVADLENQAETSRNVGYILGVCGLCFLIPAIVLAGASVFGRRMFKSSSASDSANVNPTAMPYGAFGSGSTSSPFGTGSGAFGAPPAAPPASNIPSGNIWSGSNQPSGSGSSFDAPASGPSPFDEPKEGSGSPFDPPQQ